MSKTVIGYPPRWEHLTEEQKKVFKEGLFKSKGESNNKLGALLAIAGASADDIAKYGSVVDFEEMKFLDKKRQDSSPHFRAVMQVVREVPNFWETVKGRKLKEESYDMLVKMGLKPDEKLPVTKFNAKLSEMYLQRSFRATGESYCLFQEQRDMMYNSSVSSNIAMVDVFKPLANVKFGEIQSVKEMANYSVKSGKVYLPDYNKNRKYEIDSLAHMDEDITSQMKPHRLLIDVLHENYNHWFERNPDATYSIQIMCIMEGFYDACREMGIVGISDKAAYGRDWTSQATTKGIMQTVIKMIGSYRRLVKSGFAESVARETVIAEINDNLNNRASHPQIRFYPRNDYADTPEEEREQAKKASKAGTGTSRNRVMTLDEFIETNGVKEEEA